MKYNHKTVLLHETVDSIDVKNGGVYVDATFGGGGHSGLLLSLAECVHLIAFDKDEYAIENGKEKFANADGVEITAGEFEKFAGKSTLTFVNRDFSKIKDALHDLGVIKVDGIIADFGVSSYQLDTPERGFSYMKDAELDMRMNKKDGFSACDVVNTYSQEDLTKIIRDYGEERWASKIAKTIVQKRQIKPIQTTFELVDLIKASVPAKYRQQGKHPAKRTFQAIRIEVNGELDSIQTFLTDGFDMLNVGGKMAVITFHSLEDRIVKNAFKDFSTGCICPPDFPVCVCKRVQRGNMTKKPILPSDGEIDENPRSRSAKLRVIEKIAE